MCAAKFIEGFTMLLASSCKRWRCGRVAYVGGGRLMLAFIPSLFFFRTTNHQGQSRSVISEPPHTERIFNC